MSDHASFDLFLASWNRGQGQGTPEIHFRMAGWLERAWARGETRLLLQAFRGSGKSTVAGLFAAWLLYRRPELRVMVLAADLLLARKMARNVRRIIEAHPLTRHMKPAQAGEWGAERFTVRRAMESRDPSVLARGVDSNITGGRADIIVCDDVEVPHTCDTAHKRAELRERLGEAGFVLVPGGTMLYIGTPHSWHTLYADRPREGEERAFLDGYRRLTIPVADAAGKSAWPERYPPDAIERIRRESGPNKFASQMMLVPVNAADGRLDPEALRFYGGGVKFSREAGGFYIEETGARLASCSAHWDPALGRNNGDASVLAAVYADNEGRYYLHRLDYIRFNPRDEGSEAEQQCRRVASLALTLSLPSVAVEDNGIGGYLPGMLRKELAQRRIGCAVQAVNNRRPKDLRILEAFDAVLAARTLYVHESVKDTPFLTEMREWKPRLRQGCGGQAGRGRQRDDGLDAVAGALAREPVRLAYERWGGRARQADTEFEV